MTLDFAQDLQELINLLESGRRFAFSRFGDGEYLICEGIPARVDKPAEHWISGPDSQEFKQRLNQALLLPPDPDFYFGLMCPCCDKVASSWLVARVPISSQVTFATLLTNSNYRVWNQYYHDSKLRERSILVSSAGGDFQVPRNAVNLDWGLDSLVSTLIQQADKPILVAAGPASNVIIHQYWIKGGSQAVLDVGSSLDPEIHGIKTRSYQMPETVCYNKVCTWSP